MNQINNPKVLMSIGQVAKKLQIPVHTIRFWASNFKHIKSFIGEGSRRYYDDRSVEEFKKIKSLIYDKKMRLEGVKELIKYNSIKELNPDVKEYEICDKSDIIFFLSSILKKINSLENELK
jgi:DNA-binding transcriptional MerR regulator